jgi:putative oxidoreductase
MITMNHFKHDAMITEENEKKNRWAATNAALWAAQIILAGIFTVVGFIKISTPMVDLAREMPWVSEFSGTAVFLIGSAEFVGSIGLILPSALKFKPKLTVLASYCLCVLMIIAGGFHISRKEYYITVLNLILAALSYFIAWGRSKKAVIEHSID